MPRDKSDETKEKWIIIPEKVYLQVCKRPVRHY